MSLRRRLAITALWGLVGCAPVPPVPTSTPAVDLGGTWTTVSVPGMVILDQIQAPRVQFTVGGNIQGSAACMDFVQPFRVEGERIEVAPFDAGLAAGGTDPTCAPRDRAIQAAFVRALSQADHISGGLASGRLTISGPGGEIVLAQPAVQPDP